MPFLKQKEATDEVRVRVPGFSTGEEFYTIAIQLLETMDRLGNHCRVQVFASDIDAEAINVARFGFHPKNITEDITRKRLDRFFSIMDNGFKIRKQIRDMIVFSIHNLIEDPPFSRMDLISCRNLFIHLKQDLQRKVLPTLHYALNPNGFLFLGSSESIKDLVALFAPVSIKYKIFKRQETMTPERHNFRGMPIPGLQPPASPVRISTGPV